MLLEKLVQVALHLSSDAHAFLSDLLVTKTNVLVTSMAPNERCGTDNGEKR